MPDAAVKAQVSLGTIKNLIKSGILVSIKNYNRRLITDVSLQNYIAERDGEAQRAIERSRNSG